MTKVFNCAIHKTFVDCLYLLNINSILNSSLQELSMNYFSLSAAQSKVIKRKATTDAPEPVLQCIVNMNAGQPQVRTITLKSRVH